MINEEEAKSLPAISATTVPPNHAFVTTHWSLILRASASEAEVNDALETLCRLYWRPVYAFIRRRGATSHDAEDLTQSFFTFLLEKRALKSVGPEKGRFRSFLLAALVNFLHNDWDRRNALKRGGAVPIVPLDVAALEDLYHDEQNQLLPPEAVFDRRWSADMIDRALATLKNECVRAGKARLFSACEFAISRELTPPMRAALAAELKTRDGAARVAVFRLRRRFGELLRSEVLQIVENPGEVDEEIRHPFNAVAAQG